MITITTGHIRSQNTPPNSSTWAIKVSFTRGARILMRLATAVLMAQAVNSAVSAEWSLVRFWAGLALAAALLLVLLPGSKLEIAWTRWVIDIAYSAPNLASFLGWFAVAAVSWSLLNGAVRAAAQGDPVLWPWYGILGLCGAGAVAALS
jgi:hypothetical protein